MTPPAAPSQPRADVPAASVPEDIDLALAELKAAGAEQFDSVGWHYIEVLAARARQAQGRVQALLHHKLRQSVAECAQRLASTPQAMARPKPDPAVATQPRLSPLASLLQAMALPQAADAADAPDAHRWRAPASLKGESPRVRQLRRQLHQLGVQKQVSQALAQAPDNAGPINSHMLVLRALGLMRDISPDYLNRFMVHLDTLLCLHDRSERPPAPRTARARKPVRS